MKTRFDIEIKDSKKISGGYLFTTEPMTAKQVAKVAEKLGRELMSQDKSIDSVSYSCWETDDDNSKDVENLAYVGVSLYRYGRKISVMTYID